VGVVLLVRDVQPDEVLAMITQSMIDRWSLYAGIAAIVMVIMVVGATIIKVVYP
jgi:hypothetical protein